MPAMPIAVDGEGLQGDDGEQEDDSKAGEENVKRDLIRSLLPLGAFDQGNHAVKEGFAGVGGDANFDYVGEDAGAPGDG
jgi:hypothetical protein